MKKYTFNPKIRGYGGQSLPEMPTKQQFKEELPK